MAPLSRMSARWDRIAKDERRKARNSLAQHGAEGGVLGRTAQGIGVP